MILFTSDESGQHTRFGLVGLPQRCQTCEKGHFTSAVTFFISSTHQDVLVNDCLCFFLLVV